MKILLFGRNGFVGKNIYESLSTKYEIIAPLKDELDLLNGAAVNNYFKQNKFDVIINSAVKGGENVQETTVNMYLNILKNRDSYGKLIYFGSGAEFNKTRDLIKVDENHFGESIPQDNYGIAKYIINQSIRSEPGSVNLRLFGVYGKYENYLFTFISNSILKNLLKNSIEIYKNVIFDYLYIDDLVRITEYFVLNDVNFSDYNMTPTNSISLTDIIEYIEKISGSKSQLTIKNAGFNKQYTGNNSRLLNELGSFSFTPYETGITDLFHYYETKLKNKEIDRDKLLENDYLQIVINKNKNYV